MTTRIIGAQPILYIIPALALNKLLVISNTRHAIRHTPYAIRYTPYAIRYTPHALCSLFIVSLFITTTRDYFFVWGQSPDVRAAYQSTTIAMVRSLDSPAAISTLYPSAAHDPYIAELITAQETRWIDGRTALLIPNRSTFKLLVPSSTPLHPSFAKYVQPIRTVQLRPNDLDPSFTIYSITNYLNLKSPVSNFNNALELMDAQWSAPSYKPSDVAELLTVWRVTDSKKLGALHPPAFKTYINLFTHVLNTNGEIFLQRDALDTPSWDWQTGDVILQIHQLAIPNDAARGEYKVRVGIYDRVTGERLMIKDSGEDTVSVSSLVIR